jgi:hypothetical protein
MKMEHAMEQRVNMKFCVTLQKLPSETLEMLKQFMMSLLEARIMFLSGSYVSEKAEKM